MKLEFSKDWLRKKLESDPDEPDGCPGCGAISGCCDDYPNCPGGKAMTTMRAKMRVASVTKYGEPVNQINLTFAAVGKSTAYPEGGADEDNTYAKYTPNAALQITIQNPALLDKFEVDQKYYVDFTPA